MGAPLERCIAGALALGEMSARRLRDSSSIRKSSPTAANCLSMLVMLRLYVSIDSMSLSVSSRSPSIAACLRASIWLSAESRFETRLSTIGSQ